MKTALQISGGQDSLALLYLMQEFWPDVIVVWANSGDPSHELGEFMAQVREMVPNFIEVRSYVLEDRNDRGDPTNGNWMYCCARNIWLPMHKWVLESRVRHIIRGAKASDPVNVIQPGHVDVAGILYSMPLWEWSDEQVRIYIRDRPLKPVYPHDCATCPAKRPCDRDPQTLDLQQG